MKIALLQPRVSYYVGGSEKVALNHASGLSSMDGVDVDVFTMNPQSEKKSPFYLELKNEASTINFFEQRPPEKFQSIYNEKPGIHQSRWDAESILFSNLVFDKIKNSKYDVHLSYYIGDAIFNGLGTSNVVYLGGHPHKEKEIYNAFLRFCDATIANSKNVQSMWQKKLKKNNVINNYVLSKGAHEVKDENGQNLPHAKILCLLKD